MLVKPAKKLKLGLDDVRRLVKQLGLIAKRH